ncbi:late cornified envelope protein 7A [Sciurus carolinensis]|uniref:late cornified envelope protein 7A n=1 Tax=Sciurus carolinensis TaxID=30640 RepID=UPI001FB1BDEC|nr:late cornified envelope protein 7A [Sciurus carolinensis]
MSYQQNQQKYQLSAKSLPKCPPKCPPQAPQAPASCPAPCPAPAPASSCCPSTCCVSGFGGSSCCLVSHRFPRVYLRQPQNSDCCENESSGCSSCCHGSGGCS